MRFLIALGLAVAVCLVPSPAVAQRKKKNEEEFVQDKPAIGDALPQLVVYDADGNAVSSSSLRGHYTVLTFGCLT